MFGTANFQNLNFFCISFFALADKFRSYPLLLSIFPKNMLDGYLNLLTFNLIDVIVIGKQ